MNKVYKELEDIDIRALKKLLKPMDEVYRDYMGANWRFCEIDLDSMVIYSLDYYTKRELSRKAQFYERLLVPTVFHKGNSVRYFDVLREHERLVSVHRLSPKDKDILDACKGLLCSSEKQLVSVLGIKFSGRYVREEMLAFMDSELRAIRMFGGHNFTSMLWEDYIRPLSAQNLTSDFPCPKLDAFKFSDLKVLRAMLIRSLVLNDLKLKYNQSELDHTCPHIQECGLLMVERFIAKHVPYSFKVKFKELNAVVIKENERESDITEAHNFDLEHFLNAF